MLLFLKKARHCVKTTHGTHNECFGDSLQVDNWALQGSGSAPAIWLAVSIISINWFNSKFQSKGTPNVTKQTAWKTSWYLCWWHISLEWYSNSKCLSAYTLNYNERKSTILVKTSLCHRWDISLDKCHWHPMSLKWDSNHTHHHSRHKDFTFHCVWKWHRSRNNQKKRTIRITKNTWSVHLPKQKHCQTILAHHQIICHWYSRNKNRTIPTT